MFCAALCGNVTYSEDFENDVLLRTPDEQMLRHQQNSQPAHYKHTEHRSSI